jgi:hypothetical protein
MLENINYTKSSAHIYLFRQGKEKGLLKQIHDKESKLNCNSLSMFRPQLPRSRDADLTFPTILLYYFANALKTFYYTFF